MVKRYDWTEDGMESFGEHGEYVEHSDYAALQAALKEALEGWRFWIDPQCNDDLKEQERIAELRKQFLE